MARTNYANWVWSQYFLMIAVLILSPLTPSKIHWMWFYVFGFSFILISAIAGISGVLVLGKNRKSSPEPHPESKLTTTGIYSMVRHPLYLSLILFYTGWAFLWASIGGGVGTIVLALFLDRKARLEERLLQEKFPAYSEYMKRTARFIPGIY